MGSVQEAYYRRLHYPTVLDQKTGHFIPCDIQGHLEFMHTTVLGYGRPVVIELGIQAGNSTSALLSAVEERSGELWSCDLQTREQLEGRLPADRVEWWGHPDWHVRHGDDLAQETLAWMPRECDVLFIDSDHSFEHVRDTLRVYAPRVRAGGVILMHDTHYLNVGGEDYELPGPNGPVGHAMKLFCEEKGLEWEDRTGSYGMGVIRL